MNGSQYCFTDIFFSACDTYLDAASCKQCSATLFHNAVFPNNERSAYDSREDILTMRRTSVEDLGEHRSTENRNKDRFMLHGAAPMALDDDEIDDDTAMYSAEMNANARGIFRSERNNKTSRKSDDAEISKLRRCTAWSMDSCNSERGTSSSCGSSTISRVHWDEVVCDSRELNARFKF